jgi:hypothetical protein
MSAGHPEAALKALAEHGLRCDMNPTHDMSSLDASEEFWHRYLRMLDANIRQLATNALEAAPSPSQGEPLPPIDYNKEYDRYYIPLPGGWEVQTKGKGSSFRIANTKDDNERLNIPNSPYLYELLERMAREIHAASTTPPPSSPQVAVAEFEDGAKCPLCGWRNTASAPQSAVALNWRCDGFDHHGRVVAIEKIERRRFHVYALKDDRWQADFYADHELPEYIEVGKYPDARSAMRACDDFLHEGDPVDYFGGGDFDPTKLRHGEEEATPQSAPKAAEPVGGAVTLRVDVTAQVKEQKIHDKLIELGWAPPQEPRAEHWLEAIRVSQSIFGPLDYLNIEQRARSLAQAEQAAKGCQCAACTSTPHASDCSVHNEPAYPNGPCDCGAEQAAKGDG